MHDKQLGTVGTNQLVSSVQNTLTLCNGLYHVGGRVAMMLTVCCVESGCFSCASLQGIAPGHLSGASRAMVELYSFAAHPCDAPSAGSLSIRKGLTGPRCGRHEGEGQCMESLEMEAV